MNLQQATEIVTDKLLDYCLKKEFQEDSRDINFKFIKPTLIFLSQQTRSVPFGALLGYLVGSRQDKLGEAIQFLESAIEESLIRARCVHDNWIVDPIILEHTVDRDLGIDVRPIEKTFSNAFCGKVIHKPKATRTKHLDYLNSIKFKVNRDFLDAYPDIPDNAPYKKTLPGILESATGTVYLDHKYDTRLRTYCASHANYQGTEWEKCTLKFAKEEALTDEGIKNIQEYIKQLKPDEEYLRFTANHALTEGTTDKTGIFIGADASASGMQIISVLYRCITTATNVGILDKTKDAYSEADKEANLQVPQGMNSRAVFKQCCMQHSYGGVQTPKELLGEDNYAKFRETMWKLFPAVEYYVTGIPSIYYESPVFTWTLPDDGVVQQPVIETHNVRLALPHYPHVDFGYAFKALTPKEHGVEMAANIVHSIDGYIARELIYRAAKGTELCANMQIVGESIEDALARAIKQTGGQGKKGTTFSLYKLLETPATKWSLLGNEFLTKAQAYIKAIKELDMPSFEVISIHDDFKCHPNYIGYVKWLYLEILAELAESTILQDIVTEINPKVSFQYASDGTLLAGEIRKARAAGDAKGLT